MPLPSNDVTSEKIRGKVFSSCCCYFDFLSIRDGEAVAAAAVTGIRLHQFSTCDSTRRTAARPLPGGRNFFFSRREEQVFSSLVVVLRESCVE